MTVRVGTAGWSIPRTSREAFPESGSTLERYAAVFDVVEINSSFYRHHAIATWERWAASVPGHFRFAVKLPKAATHERRLVDCGEVLDRFFGEVAALGSKLGPVLIQLPPKLGYDPAVVARFLDDVRRRTTALLAIEPRHASWAEAEAMLAERQVARVAADPPRYGLDAVPGGWTGLSYQRLHGSPAIYRTPYDERCAAIAAVARATPDAWVIFDNTMSGGATADALRMRVLLSG